MARRFAGSTSTDRIEFGDQSGTAARTMSVWCYFDAIDGTDRRLWDWATGASLIDNPRCNTTRFGISIGFSTAAGSWQTTTLPTTGQWVNICITFAGTSSDDAVIYYDGVSQTVTETGTPSGTANTSAVAWMVGNRSGNDRAFDGAMAEIGRWNRVLSTGEILSLAKGLSPALIPNGLVRYIPLMGKNSPETDIRSGITGTVTGAVADPHPRIIYPSGSQMRRFATAGGAPATSVKDLISSGFIPFAR